MAWTTYKGLTVPSSTSGDAGGYLSSDLEALADRVGPCNFTDTSNPTSGNDATQGYEVGSFWVNTSTNTWFVCVDNAPAAAEWETYLSSITAGMNVTVSGDTISVPDATDSTAGCMSAADKTKLDAATNLDTASAIVQRDASGNFSAGTITAALTGHASADLAAANNLSDVASAATARTNLGLGTAATHAATDFDAAGAAASAQSAAEAASIAATALSTDGTMAADSDTLVPSQKAVVTYVGAHGVALPIALPSGSPVFSVDSSGNMALGGTFAATGMASDSSGNLNIAGFYRGGTGEFETDQGISGRSTLFIQGSTWLDNGDIVTDGGGNIAIGSIEIPELGAPVITGGNVTAGNLTLFNCPTSDPHVAGAVWNNSGALNISSG